MLAVKWYICHDGKADSKKDAHTLLDSMLAEHGLPTVPITKTPEGRPYLVEVTHADFSISHAKGLAACVLATSHTAPPRVGIDAEVSTIDTALAKKMALRFFAPCELAYFKAAGESAEAFTAVWTRKEAYAKHCGDGLAHHLTKTDTMCPDFEKNNSVRFHTPNAPAPFIITVCAAAHLGDLSTHGTDE